MKSLPQKRMAERTCRVLSVPEFPTVASAGIVKERLQRELVDHLVFVPGPNEQMPLVIPGGGKPPRGSALKFLILYWLLTCGLLCTTLPVLY